MFPLPEVSNFGSEVKPLGSLSVPQLNIQSINTGVHIPLSESDEGEEDRSGRLSSHHAPLKGLWESWR